MENPANFENGISLERMGHGSGRGGPIIPSYNETIFYYYFSQRETFMHISSWLSNTVM